LAVIVIETLANADRRGDVGLAESAPLPNGSQDPADPSIIHRLNGANRRSTETHRALYRAFQSTLFGRS
jgi:hypothetical protein